MFKLMQTLRTRREDEKGASAVEYGLLVAAIAAIIVVVVFAIGKLVDAGFNTTCSEFASEDDNSATLATSCQN